MVKAEVNKKISNLDIHSNSLSKTKKQHSSVLLQFKILKGS